MQTLRDLIAGEVIPGSRILCPFHDDTNPSCHYYPNGHLHCFACGEHAFSVAEAVSKSMGMSRNLAEAYLQRWGNVPAQEPAEPRVEEVAAHVLAAIDLFCTLSRQNLASNQPLVEKLAIERGLQSPLDLGLGLSEEWMLKELRYSMQALGYDQDTVQEALHKAGVTNAEGRYQLGRRIVIPEIRSGAAIWYQARSMDQKPKFKYMNPRIPKPLFGLDSVSKGEMLFCNEGPFDVLPLIEQEQAGIAVVGAHVRPETLVPYVNDRPVIVGLDSDETGERESATLVEGLKQLGVNAVRIRPPKPFKDFGEWLANKGTEHVLAEVEWNV